MAVPLFLQRSLKFRMTGVVILLVLAATIIVTWVAMVLAERDMKFIIGDQQYALLTAAAAHLDDQLGAKRLLLAELAESVPEEARRDPRRMQDFFDEHPTVRNSFYNLVTFDRQGRLQHSARDSNAEATLSAAGKVYFDDTMTLKAGVISAPFRSQLSGMPVVLITQPVFDRDGEVALVIAGSIDLDNSPFFDQISAQKPGKTGFMFIMTAEGILVHHPNKKRLLEHINARPGYNQATEMALEGFEGWTEATNKDGNAGIYAYKRLKSINWVLGVRFPTNEAFAPMIEMRHRAIIAATVFAAIAGAVAWAAIMVMLKPLGRLRRNIADIRNGKSAIGVLQRRRRDEIGELSTAFHVLMSERESAQEQTRDSESLIRTILERAPDAIVSSDHHGIITEWNTQAERTFGWTREQAVGRDVAELIIPPALREAHHAGIARFASSGVGPVVNTRVRLTALHRDGHEIPIELSIGALKHGEEYYATAFLHDVTERLRYEQQIAASEQRIRLIADNLPVLIAYLDQDLRFQFVNATSRHWLEIDPEQLLGKHLSEGVGQRQFEEAEPHLSTAFRGRIATYELQAHFRGGLHTLETTFVPDVGRDGVVAGVYSLTHDTTRMKEIEEKLIQLARVDTLTGIANRLMFEEILQLAIGRAGRNRLPMALAYLDIDNFKAINDSLGHGAGDCVLREFASRLVGNVRITDTVARLAGDEFVIIFEQVHNREEAAQLANKIVEAVREEFTVEGRPMRVSTSIGVALFEHEHESAAELVARADTALYAAKRNGRDGYALAE
ncbi:diguanylate cyclase [Oxalobacteraceae bacterium]|nr:diguanylate cyclase [Oxalobacteraceae bacterium]